nr:TetR/AcrR family transcriptional regulator [Tomitella biformata]
MRQEILDAAFDCFAERGYHATAIADIAASLGIGHGTFYRYFENKRDIISHVIDGLIGRIVAALATENAPDAANTLDEYRVQVKRIGDALTSIFFEDPRIPRLLLLQAPSVDAELTQRMLELLDGATALTAAYLAHGVDRGYLRADLDIDGTSTAINGMILASAIRGLRSPDRAAMTRLNTAIQQLMFHGLAS